MGPLLAKGTCGALPPGSRNGSELPVDGVGEAQRAGIDVDVLQDDHLAVDGVGEICRGHEKDCRGEHPSEPPEDGSRSGSRADDDHDGPVHVDGTPAMGKESRTPQTGARREEPSGAMAAPTGKEVRR